ncbi:MarR family winged helix-turn-helix transcriptional regulator [Streptomyces sp. NBC_01334]|uniref:MarR family winged helix-turn-helix transcriptional regulator n=1 Tax=Streptomyces sp. NBC_01334 TaxID=2903827 RepID=UPI002E134F16|nr:MarR family winged helix-turn-helix transcriptional regulator [Streptomyces sp. NBC_01334]
MTATQGRAAAGNGTGEGPATGAEPAAGGRAATGDRPRSGDGPDSGDGRSTGGRRGSGGRTGSGDPVRPAQPSEPVGPVRNDTVAAVVRQWQTVRPDLDTGPMEIIGRVNRCAALLQQAEDAPLRRAGLSRAEFDLLGALRRTGHELTPGELARETFSSGAAVTKRLKQLTERGLVERRVDSRDRRVAHLRLTDAGRDLVDGIMPEQLVYESAVLSALDDGRQGELADLLGELLSRLEGHMRALRV